MKYHLRILDVMWRATNVVLFYNARNVNKNVMKANRHFYIFIFTSLWGNDVERKAIEFIPLS
jgi:hypothetical protein